MDIYPSTHERIEDAVSMEPALGGSSGNIAAGLSRLGAQVEMLSMVSNDPIGRFVLNQCALYGIGTRHISKAPFGTNTSLAFAENRLDDFKAVIYRNNAADLMLDMDAVDAVDFDAFDALVITGTALSAEPSRSATIEAIKRARFCVLDLDYRAAAWVDEAPAAIYREALGFCDMAIGNDEEFALLGGVGAARAFGQEKLAIYKMGEKGAITIAQGRAFETPVFAVDALKPVGAGDAFLAGFLMALAEGRAIERAVREGAAHAAIVVSRPACAPAMATREELDQFLKERGM